MSQSEVLRAGRPKTPKTRVPLERLVTDWQMSSGQPVARLNAPIAAMAIVGACSSRREAGGARANTRGVS